MKDHWTCQICGKPIAPDKGYITIANRDDGGYPRPVKPSAPPEVDPRTGFAKLDLITPPEPLGLKFAVLHAKCDRHKNSSEYFFGLDRAQTLEHFVFWMNHLGGKDWMGTRELLAFMNFWFTQRGVKVTGSYDV